MKSINENGHDRNAANFEDLISRCAGFGPTYNPSLNAIKIANMNTLRTAVLTILATEKSAETAHLLAEDNREIVFKPRKNFATRVMAALKACGASPEIIKDAQAINRKIQGHRAKRLKKAELRNTNNPVEKTISVSQQSYDSIIEHYSKLIDLLSAISAYNPNEADLKISGLNTLLSTMKMVNTAHINATTNLLNARIARNEGLYKRVTGLLDIAQDCKDYVKSVYGAQHAKYKEVSSIQFKRLVKM